MIQEIKKYVIVGLMLVLSIVIVFGCSRKEDKIKNTIENLVIYGDNIDTDFKPFMEGSVPYIAVDTISKVIDEYIYYDKVSTKVIITTYNDVIKLKVGEKVMSRN